MAIRIETNLNVIECSCGRLHGFSGPSWREKHCVECATAQLKRENTKAWDLADERRREVERLKRRLRKMERLST